MSYSPSRATNVTDSEYIHVFAHVSSGLYSDRERGNWISYNLYSLEIDFLLTDCYCQISRRKICVSITQPSTKMEDHLNVSALLSMDFLFIIIIIILYYYVSVILIFYHAKDRRVYV